MDLSPVVERLGKLLGASLAPSDSPDLVEVGDRLVWECFDRKDTLADRCMGWVDVYQALVEDELVAEGKTIDVVVPSSDVPTAIAAILCQQAGLPLYTVVLADDERQQVVRYTQGKAPCPQGWERVAASDWAKTYPDVVAGWADEEMADDAIRTAYEEYDYLLHPDTALAWAVTDIYWEEAEHDRVTVVAASRHPYERADAVWQTISGNQLSQQDAVKALYLDSGWEIPQK